MPTTSSPPSISTLKNETVPPRHQPDQPGNLTVRWVESVEELESLKQPWTRLAERSLSTNASFDPNFLIPAMRHFGNSKVKVLIVEESGNPLDKNATRIFGLMPLIPKSFYHLPIRCLEIWSHDQSFDQTPLLSKAHAGKALEAMLDFLAQEKVGLLSFDTVSKEPEFQSILDNAIQCPGRSQFQRDQFSRAAFRPIVALEDYKKQFVSKSVKKNYGRLSRRLAELGEVQLVQSDAFSDYEKLTNQFLEMEASGWKVEAGTALACQPTTQEFYRELIKSAANDGKARFLSLTLDGKPIAMLSDLRSGQNIYSFKTAFDENYSSFSPGLQIEIGNIESMHQSGIQLADSCTAPDNSTINRIWGQRLEFQSLVIGLRPGVANWATQIMPSLQTVAHKIKNMRSKK
ncbi:GNAT family N-acetyltransferase [Mariniblastus sp.]|nr:GNAT family N-acetyltransferase [Mariniblastus sp.]MDA7925708.1 GNAT family N-acetyltransferase [Mariniblastus sp.]MDB4368033.1 GNAT family N-acetyltransferase [Mariniblastus sp.]